MADIKKELNDIKNAVYGREVRGSIHDGIKKINEEVENTTDRQDSVEAQFQSVLDETTGKDVISAPEITAARVGADDTNYPNLKERLDTEYQKLSSRLDTEYQKLSSQLAQKATKAELYQSIGSTKTYLDNQLSQLGDMTPKSAFPTLQDLENTYPNGAEGIYLVGEYWYYWNILSSKWTIGGTYQALPWDEFMTEEGQEWVV